MGSTPYVSPKVPTLYTAMTTGSDAWNPQVYGASVNPYIFEAGKVIEIVVDNQDAAGSVGCLLYLFRSCTNQAVY